MIDIRPALPDEYAAAGEVTVTAYLAEGALAPGDPYLELLRDAASRAAGAELLVAVDETGAVVGTVTSCPLGSPYRELGTDAEGEFRALAVSPAARGRGVGTLLVRRCLERAAADGFDQVVNSSAEWMTTAHRMYRRLGFTRAPERDWWPRPDVHLLAYVHPLG